jgi:hypothetical protein
VPDVIVLRLLAELAHAHAFDHVGALRTDGRLAPLFSYDESFFGGEIVGGPLLAVLDSSRQTAAVPSCGPNYSPRIGTTRTSPICSDPRHRHIGSGSETCGGWFPPLLFFASHLLPQLDSSRWNYSSVSEFGEIELLAGIALFMICGLLLLNIVLALKDLERR